MTTPISSMTSSEAEDCRGMWCEYPGEGLAILVDFEADKPVLLCFDGKPELRTFDPSRVIPNKDVIRSHTPGGEPATTDTQTETVGEHGEYEDEYGFGDFPDGTVVTRFVTQWQED